MTASGFGELLARAREAGDPAPLVGLVPWTAYLGIGIERDASGVLVARMRFAPHLVGNALLPALHGGTIGSLLESIAIFQLLWEGDAAAPRTINITVEYLRSARTVDTFARADITRQGRRVATVHAIAWQDDPARPVAAANAHFLVTPKDE